MAPASRPPDCTACTTEKGHGCLKKKVRQQEDRGKGLLLPPVYWKLVLGCNGGEGTLIVDELNPIRTSFLPRVMWENVNIWPSAGPKRDVHVSVSQIGLCLRLSAELRWSDWTWHDFTSAPPSLFCLLAHAVVISLGRRIVLLRC